MTADASLTVMQSEHADAKLLEDYEEVAWTERIKTALEARDIDSRRDRSMIQSFLEKEIGVGLDALGLDDNAATDIESDDSEETGVALDETTPATRPAEGDDD